MACFLPAVLIKGADKKNRQKPQQYCLFRRCRQNNGDILGLCVQQIYFSWSASISFLRVKKMRLFTVPMERFS